MVAAVLTNKVDALHLDQMTAAQVSGEEDTTRTLENIEAPVDNMHDVPQITDLPENSLTNIKNVPMSLFREDPVNLAKRLHELDSSVNVSKAINSTMNATKTAHKNNKHDKSTMMMKKEFTEFPNECSLAKDRILFNDKEGDAIYKDFLGSGTEYDDEDFPDDASSLYWNMQLAVPGVTNDTALIRMYQKNVTGWGSPRDLDKDAAGKPDLWGKKGVRPIAPKVGILADKWVQTGIAAVADRPEQLKALFTNKDYPAEGIFQVQFYFQGKPTKILLDDKLPVNKTENTTLGMDKTKDGAWWPAILEKAFAKYYGNHVKLNGGDYVEALRTLTGAPIIKFNTTNQTEAELFANISKNANDSNLIMAYAEKDVDGLKNGTLYHIHKAMNITPVKTKPKATVQLIMLRSAEEKGDAYTGAWGQGDAKWTKALKTTLNLTGPLADKDSLDPQFFYMTAGDFQKAFEKYTVVQTNTTTITKDVMPVVNARHEAKYYFVNPKKQPVSLTLDHLSKRMQLAACAKADNRYYIKVRDEKLEIVQQGIINYHIGYGNLHFHELAAGDYSVEVFNVGKNTSESNFTLTTYAKDKAAIADPVGYLSQPLAALADKVVKAEDGHGIKGSHVEDAAKKILTVRVDKEDKFTGTVTMEFLTTGGFPWKNLVSNIDWKKDAKASVVTNRKGTKITSQHYRLVTYCRSESKACVYQIPELEKFVSVEYW